MPLKRIARKAIAKPRAKLPNGRAAPVSVAERKALARLRSTDPLARSDALGALGRFGPKYERIVLAAMRDPFSEVVEGAIPVLAEINPAKYSSLIASKMLDPEGNIAAQAVVTSGVIRNEKSVPIMRRMVLDKKVHPHVRAMAVKTLFDVFGVKDRGVLRAAEELRKKAVLADLSNVK